MTKIVFIDYTSAPFRALVNILNKNPYFFPTPQIVKLLLLPCFFYFRKICSCHHCHHFHLFLLSIKYWVGGDDFFVIGKRGFKHETFLMWNRVRSFLGKPIGFCHVKFFLCQSLFLPSYFLPPWGGSWPEYLLMF